MPENKNKYKLSNNYNPYTDPNVRCPECGQFTTMDMNVTFWLETVNMSHSKKIIQVADPKDQRTLILRHQ